MNENRAFRGVWIPADIWLNRELTLNEKVMLIEIDSLQHPERGCFKSNAALAEFFGLSPSRVSEIITSLANKGLVRIQQIRHGKSIVERRVYMVRRLENAPQDGIRDPEEGIRDSEEGYSENRRGVFEIPKVSNTRESNTRERDTPPTPPGGQCVAKRPSKPAQEKFDPFNVPIPDFLSSKSWVEWCSHRQQIKKPLTQLSTQKQFAQLAALREQGHDPTAVINHCIANGYQGLFPPRSANHEASRPNRRETPLEAGVREIEEMRERIANGNILEWLNQSGPVPFG